MAKSNVRFLAPLGAPSKQNMCFFSGPQWSSSSGGVYKTFLTGRVSWGFYKKNELLEAKHYFFGRIFWSTTSKQAWRIPSLVQKWPSWQQPPKASSSRACWVKADILFTHHHAMYVGQLSSQIELNWSFRNSFPIKDVQYSDFKEWALYVTPPL